MSGARQTDEAVIWFCHWRMTELLDAGRTQKELAGLGGIPPSAVNHLRKHGRGVGATTAAGFAKILGFETRGQLVDEADRWWSTPEARRYARQAKSAMEREQRIKDIDEDAGLGDKKSTG